MASRAWSWWRTLLAGADARRREACAGGDERLVSFGMLLDSLLPVARGRDDATRDRVLARPIPEVCVRPMVPMLCECSSS